MSAARAGPAAIGPNGATARPATGLAEIAEIAVIARAANGPTSVRTELREARAADPTRREGTDRAAKARAPMTLAVTVPDVTQLRAVPDVTVPDVTDLAVVRPGASAGRGHPSRRRPSCRYARVPSG